jgi:putative hydrolase of the HAD superfamily
MDRGVVVFDGDDTLWWTEHLYDDARIRAGRLVAGCGLDALKWDEVERALDVHNVSRFGLSRERFPTSCVEAYEQVAELSGMPVNTDIRAAIWEAADSVFTRGAPVVEGAVEVLQEVAQMSRVVLLTKGDQEIQQHRLESSGLEHLFDRVVIVPTKSAEQFRFILQMFSVSPQGSWSVGNSWRSDIEPAIGIGMHGIWIDAHVWEYERHKVSPDNHDAAHVARSLREVPAILRSWTASSED